MNEKVMVVGLCALLGMGSVASADTMLRPRKVESTEQRAMGGVDVALDTKNPANAALDSKKAFYMSLFESDVNMSISEFIDVYRLVPDVMDFKDTMGLSDYSLDHKLTTLRGIIDRVKFDLDTRIRLEAVRINLGSPKVGRFQFGAYAESEVGAKVRLPEGLDESSLVFGKDGKPKHIDIGKDMDVLQAKGRADAGGFLSYGYGGMSLWKKAKLAAGIQAKGFHRWLVPMYTIHFKKEMKDDKDIDISDFECQEGNGFAVDLYTTLDFNDPYVNARLAMELQNTYAKTWYSDGTSQQDMQRMAIGGAVHPLYMLGIKDWVVATDLEDVGHHEGPTWQFGTSYILGKERINFTPRLGLVINQRDVFGQGGNHLLTGGFSTMLGIFEIAGAYEYNWTTEAHNAAVKLGFKF